MKRLLTVLWDDMVLWFYGFVVYGDVVRQGIRTPKHPDHLKPKI